MRSREMSVHTTQVHLLTGAAGPARLGRGATCDQISCTVDKEHSERSKSNAIGHSSLTPVLALMSAIRLAKYNG
jgi:hypothetical protein